MVYLNNINNDAGLKLIVDNIRQRKNFSGETLHWIGASMKHGVLNILPFNFVSDDLPASVLKECFPNEFVMFPCFKSRHHVLLQGKLTTGTIETLSAIVDNGIIKTTVFNSFVVCSVSNNGMLQALTIDEVADVLEQIQLNPFIGVIEVSRYY